MGERDKGYDWQIAKTQKPVTNRKADMLTPEEESESRQVILRMIVIDKLTGGYA